MARTMSRGELELLALERRCQRAAARRLVSRLVRIAIVLGIAWVTFDWALALVRWFTT